MFCDIVLEQQYAGLVVGSGVGASVVKSRSCRERMFGTSRARHGIFRKFRGLPLVYPHQPSTDSEEPQNSG
jgi:hypothetical protein